MAQTTSTYQQQAYDHIKWRILELKLKPGEYIADTQIAEELGISRTPVREALYRLENEGLLTSVARRGWRVYALSLKDIHDIFDIKASVEGMIAAQAAACKDAALHEALRASIRQMREAVAADDPKAWLAADFALHEVLFRMVNNDRAERIVSNLNDQWHRLRIGFAAMEGRIARSTQEHSLFVEAILDGDADRAERAMRDHLNQVRAELVRLLVNMVLPFADEGV